MNPFCHTGLSISDSLKSVRKSVLIYETIIQSGTECRENPKYKEISKEKQKEVYYITEKVPVRNEQKDEIRAKYRKTN